MNTSTPYLVSGAGLGLKRALMGPLSDHPPSQVGFYEIAPENWIQVGGKFARKLRQFTEQYPFMAHGLSLSIGSPAPLDEEFVRQIGKFLDEHNIRGYSEHLSYCGDEGHLYDLMPIPFTEEAVHYVAKRIQRVQDILERRIAMENVSYYAAPGKEMNEIEFINAVLEEADCELLLDVNNIYVNSINHNYDAEQFLKSLPADRIQYFHIAGHYQEAEDLLVDTHGAPVVNPVWELLDKAYEFFDVVPTLLERDFNIPPLEELLQEIEEINTLQKKWQDRSDEVSRHG